MNDTRNRILDVAREIWGRDPSAAMDEIAAVAGVVRRTVYGHFPARADLVRSLTERAVEEIAGVLAEVDDADAPADAVWAGFVERLWPVADRYRVLVTLRRGEHGPEIHALLRPVDEVIADLVRRGQDGGAFGRHLPAELLGGLAEAAVFTIADARASGGTPDVRVSGGTPDVRAATITSLLLLGVPEQRARALAGPPDRDGPSA